MQLRIRPDSLARIDAIAADRDWSRSTALRTLLALGLRAWDKGER